MKLKMFSEITGDVVDLGIETTDMDAVLGLGETMATNREDQVIVFVEGRLPKWEGLE